MRALGWVRCGAVRALAPHGPVKNVDEAADFGEAGAFPGVFRAGCALLAE